MVKVTEMFFRIFFFCSMLVFCSFPTLAGEAEARVVLNMNTGWAFHRGEVESGGQPGLDDSGWIAATIPHIMQLEKKHCGGDIIYDGVGWYRRTFRVPSQYKDKQIKISFEGVMNACEVYLNGQKISAHRGGYVGFVTDITTRINWDRDNLLAVRVSAEYDPLTPPGKPQAGMDFYYYSGIYRDVEMVISDPLHITHALEEDEVAGGGIFVTYPVVGKEKAVTHVKAHVRNEGKRKRKAQLRTQLIDKSGKIVTCQLTPFRLSAGEAIHLEQNLEIVHPSLWHPYDPNLYTLQMRLLKTVRL